MTETNEKGEEEKNENKKKVDEEKTKETPKNSDETNPEDKREKAGEEKPETEDPENTTGKETPKPHKGSRLNNAAMDKTASDLNALRIEQTEKLVWPIENAPNPQTLGSWPRVKELAEVTHRRGFSPSEIKS